jgi:hypothetical protein
MPLHRPFCTALTTITDVCAYCNSCIDVVAPPSGASLWTRRCLTLLWTHSCSHITNLTLCRNHTKDLGLSTILSTLSHSCARLGLIRTRRNSAAMTPTTAPRPISSPLLFKREHTFLKWQKRQPGAPTGDESTGGSVSLSEE